MKFNFVKSVEKNFNSCNMQTNKKIFKLNENKNLFKDSLNSVVNSQNYDLQKLKENNNTNDNNLNFKELDDDEKIKLSNKEDKDNYIKEALEFLNSLTSFQNININEKSKEISLNALVKESYGLSSLELNNSKEVLLDGNVSKEDLFKQGNLLEILKNLSKQLQMILDGEKSGINKEEILKKIQGMENSLNISNKDILELIKNRLQNLEETLNKLSFKNYGSEIKGFLEKLGTTEKLMKNLIQKQVKLNENILNKDEKKSFENMLKSIDEKSSDKFMKNFRDVSIVESNSKEDLYQNKEEKILNDIIKGKELKNKHNNNLFYGIAQKNNENNLKIESIGSVKITPQNPIDGVIKTVKYMNINNMHELTVKVNPAELGELTIKLTMGSDGMKASILATNKDTYNLLNANINDLKNSLNQQNIKVVDVFINLNNNNENNQSFQNQYNEANLNNNQNGSSNKREENENIKNLNERIDDIKIDEEKEENLINAFA